MHTQNTPVYINTDEKKDETLWKIAKKRAAFKQYVAFAICINSFLVVVWIFTTGINSYFWPAWAMLGWGISIVFQYADAYLNNGFFSEEKEFLKLKQKAKNNG